MTYTLVLVRHGQSQWNADNLFTGWWDADLTDQGRTEATRAGELLADAGVLPEVVHTSLQTRAIRTAELALEVLDRQWLPVRRSWRLNERHYGDLTGKNKVQAVEDHGEEQVHRWRRGYDTPPPPITDGNRFNPNDDPRYAVIPPDVLPVSECLADVVARMMPYWYDGIVPDLVTGRTVLVAAHGNSLRALVKHLDAIGDDAIAQVDLPTGVPLVYELGADFRPADAGPDRQPLDRALGDPEAVRAAAQKVAEQAKGER